jgi:Flp pilus assembly pilin Flp
LETRSDGGPDGPALLPVGMGLASEEKSERMCQGHVDTTQSQAQQDRIEEHRSLRISSPQAVNGRETSMKNFLTTLWTDDSGQDMAEYALLLVLIAVVVAITVAAFRDAIVGGFERATEELNDPATE